MAAGLLRQGRAGSCRGGRATPPFAPDRALGVGGGARRPLRGRARRAAFFRSVSGADAVLRRLLRMGALGARQTPPPTGKLRLAHLRLASSRVPALRALFQQLSDPGRLQPLGLVEVLDWTAAALDRVERAAFFDRFRRRARPFPYFYEPFLETFDPAAAETARRLVHARRGGALHGRPRRPRAEGRPRHRRRAGGRERLRARSLLRHRRISRGGAAPHRRQPRR